MTRIIKESELILLLSNHGKKGIELLYDQYAAVIFYKICQVVPESSVAEDILHHTFATIWEKFSTFNIRKECFYAWMIGIAETRIKEIHPQNNAALSHSDILSLTECRMLELVYFWGYTREEIAKEFSVSSDTLNNQLRQALNKLRKADVPAPSFNLSK